MHKLSNVAIIIVAACVVMLTGTVVHREFFTSPASAGPTSMRKVDNWEQLTRTGHALGSAKAPVKIIEFADFQCTYRRAAAS